jgi:hypothetical protein
MINQPPGLSDMIPIDTDEWGLQLSNGPIIPVPSEKQARALVRSDDGYHLVHRTVSAWVRR